MIKVLNENKQVLHLLRNLKDFYIESDLATGDKLISFKIAKGEASAKDIIQERYLRTATDQFVIKEVNYADAYYVEVYGKLDLEDLKAKAITSFESVEQTARQITDEVLANHVTGWITEFVDVPVSKRRTIRKDEACTAYEIIMDVCKSFNIEVEFDTLNKVIRFKQAIGSSRGAYVYSDLNLKKTDLQSDTYDFKTRLYAYGKDGLTFSSINNGKEYVDNNQHSNKIIEMVWKDDRYTIAENLLEDAQIKLNDLSKPRVSYTLDVMSLATKSEYSIIDFKLGDSIKVLDKANEKIDSQRIVKITEYPLTPEKNKITLSNTRVVFTDNTQEIRDAISSTNSEIVKTRTELMKAVEESSNLIKANNGGYIITRYNEDNQPYEQLIMNTDNILTATQVWRWNLNGLGFSSSGYNGTYEIAITNDGKINANFITAGQLNASIIKAGILQSLDGSSWINLETGYFNFANKIMFNEDGFEIKLSDGKSLESALTTQSDLISSKVSQTDFDAIGKVDLELWARHYINSPMLVKNVNDPAYIVTGRDGASFTNMSQVIGGMFNNAIPELQRIQGGIDSPATAWALLNMVKLYKLTNKEQYLTYVNLIANYFVNRAYDSTYYGANIKVVPNVVNYNSETGNWEASKNFFHLRTLYHVQWALLEAYEVTLNNAYKTLAEELMDTANIFAYSVNTRAGTEIATYMYGAQYNTIHSFNNGGSYSPEWTTFNNTTLDVMWKAVTLYTDLFGTGNRTNAEGISYSPLNMRDDYATHLKYMYDNEGLRRSTGHKMLYCFTKFNWADPTTDGLYNPTPMNWDFIEDVWGTDQWFTGDLQYWAINGFRLAGYTAIAESLMSQYYTLKLENRGTEILFYDRYDKDGNPLPDDQSVSIVFTALFMDTMTKLGDESYNKDCVETIKKYQIKSSSAVIDGGFPWDIIYNNSVLESKSLGEIIHAPLENVTLSFTVDGILSDTQGLTTELSVRLSQAEQKITPDAITSTVTQSTTYITDINSKEPMMFKQNTAPTHLLGRLWLDTSSTPNVLKRSTGTAWVKATPTTAGEVGAYSASDGSALVGRIETAESSITQNANNIALRVTTTTYNGLVNRVSSAESSITQNANNIALRVAKTDYNGNTIASLINQSATTIAITASKINLNGLVTANNNFKILTDGSMEAKNAKLTGEINTVDGSGRAVRVFNRNLVFYSPTNQSVRGILSSSSSVGTNSEGMSVLLPKSTTRNSIFSIDRMSSFNDTTGVWAVDKVLFQIKANSDGKSYVIANSDVFQVTSDLTAPRAMQMGTISLNANTAKSLTFSTAMQGSPVIVLTPMHSITGAVVTAKLVSTSNTGFSAIIQGSPTSQNVTFYWIAMT